MKKGLFLVALLGLLALVGCETKNNKTSGTTTAVPTTTEDTRSYYYFVIYEKDSNDDLSDNKIVASYEIRYSTGTYVSDSLIKDGNKYYFVEGGTDYLVLEDSQYGLSYKKGYFKNYSECANNTEIDVSWSKTLGNGESLMTGISTTPLDGLNQYGFVINGWA